MGCGASKPGEVAPGEAQPAKAAPAAPPPPASVPSTTTAPASNGPTTVTDGPVVLVFGNAASGADAACAEIAQKCGGTYLSQQKLLKDEVTAETQTGKELAAMIKQGKIVPSPMMIELLVAGMAGKPAPFVVEGFVKSADGLEKLEARVGACALAICLETESDDAAKAKLVADGASDDVAERRLRMFTTSVMPVVELLEKRPGVVARIPCANVEAAINAVAAVKPGAPSGGAAAYAAAEAEAEAEVAAPAAAEPEPEWKTTPLDVPVFFVLGGPGSGKGTQCAKLVAHYSCAHFSAGDLLRAEIATGSEMGKTISEMIKSGKIVQAETTIDLLRKAMFEAKTGGAKGPFLIDGFPRSMDNLQAYEAQAPKCKAVLFFEASEEAMTERLLERGKTSGRTDDNADTIKRRFATFQNQSLPVVEHLEAEQKCVHRIDALQPIDDVFAATCKIVDEVLA